MDVTASQSRLLLAERQGLRLAILCRTIALGFAFLWFVAGSLLAGYAPSPWGVAALLALLAFGVGNLMVIGTPFDRWWLKYVIYAVDILGICALFAIMPASRGAEIPQIVAFRAYGIYYLFPMIALACLSLSWRLVVWSGAMVVLGWWTAFATVVRDMDRRLSWGDMPANASLEDYETIFLSIDFIGVGNRIEETGLLLTGALILAVAVYRARQVFFAQVAAEAEREAEREARERIAGTLGRYVPESVARKLISDESALAPHVRHGAALVMDIRDFTAFAADRDPREVITELNEFLAHSADVVSDHDGVVITFTGDGFLAAFNAPLDIPNPEAAALAAARALVDHAAGTGFSVRVGVAAGPIAAGSVGSSTRQAFTVYGDTVNRAARLEALGKTLGETVLVDAGIAEADAGANRLRSVGRHAIKGIPEPVAVWADGGEPAR